MSPAAPAASNKENASPTKLPAKKKPKKQQTNKSKSAETKSNATGDTKPRTARVHFSQEDDRIMVNTFLEQKNEGNATDNGGWKDPALQAVVRALEGSEKESGGAPKNVRNVRDHWAKLKKDYQIFKELASLSGWGWDSVNDRVQASDEQWDTYLASHPNRAKYRNATFPLYEDMDELLNGALATGKGAFHPGKVIFGDGSDSDGDSGRDAGIELDNDDDEDQDEDDEDIKSTQTSSFSSLTKATPLKRKTSARDSSASGKRHRGRQSTSGAISEMSQAITGMAAVFSQDSTAGESEQSRLARAVKLLGKEEGISRLDKAKLMLVAQKDIGFADLILSVDDAETRSAVYTLKLDEIVI